MDEIKTFNYRKSDGLYTGIDSPYSADDFDDVREADGVAWQIGELGGVDSVAFRHIRRIVFIQTDAENRIGLAVAGDVGDEVQSADGLFLLGRQGVDDDPLTPPIDLFIFVRIRPRFHSNRTDGITRKECVQANCAGAGAAYVDEIRPGAFL